MFVALFGPRLTPMNKREKTSIQKDAGERNHVFRLTLREGLSVAAMLLVMWRTGYSCDSALWLTTSIRMVSANGARNCRRNTHG